MNDVKKKNTDLLKEIDSLKLRLFEMKKVQHEQRQIEKLEIEVLKKQLTDQKQATETIAQIDAIVNSMGLNVEKNINMIVEKTRELLLGTCCVYNRFDEISNKIIAWSHSNLPKDFACIDNASGHVCYEATKRSVNKPVVIPDLGTSIYKDSDPRIKKYSLKSYLGFPVKFNRKTQGALCVVYNYEKEFTSIELYTISTLARIISLEEERNFATASMKESEKNLREVVNTIPDMVWLKDENGVYKFCNKKFQRLLNKPEEEIIGKTDYDFVWVDLADEIRKKDQDAIDAGSVIRNDEEATFAYDGHHELLETAKTPMYNEDGTVAGVLGIARNITDRKNSENELQLKEKYLQILNKAKEILLDNKGNTLQEYVNVLGHCTDLCRTFLYIKDENVFEDEIFNLEVEYVLDGHTPLFANPDLIHIKSKNFRKISEFLNDGKILDSNIPPLYDEDYAVMEALGIKSFILIPLMLNSECIGFLGFNSCDIKKQWNNTEKEFLASSANDLVQYLIRQKSTDLIKVEHDRFQLVLDAIPAAVYVADLETSDLIFSNKYFIDLFGKKEGFDFETILKHDHELISSFTRSNTLFDKNGKPLDPTHIEFHNATSMKWYRITDQAIKWVDDRYVRLEIAVDITELKEIEQVLIEKEAHTSAIINSLHEAYIVTYDRDARWLSFHGAKNLESRYGINVKNMLEKKLDDVFSDAVSKQKAKQIRDVFRTGQSVSDRFMAHYPNGDFWHDISLAPVFDHDNEVKLVVAYVRDISLYKNAEIALEDSEERFRELADMLPEAIIETDENLNIIYANQQVKSLFNYEHIDTENYINLLELIIPEQRTVARSYIDSQYESDNIGAQEFVAERTNETTFPALFNLIPRQYNGKTIGYRGIIVDISQMKKTEEELHRLAKLESLALLGGGIAHNFKNILASVNFNTSLAKYKPDRADIYLDRIEKAVIQATSLASRFQTFSSGGNPMIVIASIAEVLNDTINIALSGTEMSYNLQLEADVYDVKGDSKQLNEVFMNLLINAIQAMPKGGQIEITGENIHIKDTDSIRLTAGKYVKISVLDNGIGISKNNIDQIFDPFYTDKAEGTGLGLTTVQSIIAKHNGIVMVDSHMGYWTRFDVYLPASDVKINKEKVEEDKLQSKYLKILFMDDNDDIRENISELADLLDYDIDTASCGVETIELYKKAFNNNKAYDAVILDLAIQGSVMQGEDVLLKLKQLDPKVKAIVFSGHSAKPIVMNYKDYGFVGKLDKPISIERLSTVLNDICKKDL